jgi:hypothetical protein
MLQGGKVKPEKVRQQLIEQVSVTRQMVTYAKAYFLGNYKADTRDLINSLLDNVDAKMPGQIVIHQSVDTSGVASQAAKSISWRLAGCEAIWGLIANNYLIPGSSNHFEESISVEWTTVVPGSGGHTGGWDLNEFSLPLPRKVLMKPSGIDGTEQPLSDPDIYMHELNIHGLGKDIERALRESVLCFKNELFLGCLALLGRASEGAWIELGLALAKAIPEGVHFNGVKLQNEMEDKFLSISKKISKVLKAYEQKDVFSDIYKACGYKPSDLKSIVVWADAVRESRNSIHYGVEPAMSNSYEKVAALLIGAVPNFRVIYSIIRMCNELVA